MYVSKELALILKENGFNYNQFDLIIAPTEQEVVDWIFDEIGLESNPNTHIDYERKRLKFWYTTLLEHNFGLMHEFIGRLEDWFESNDIYLFYNPVTNIHTGKVVGHSFHIINNKWKGDIHLTKQQAKHEAIMKCFELLNSDKDDAQ